MPVRCVAVDSVVVEAAARGGLHAPLLVPGQPPAMQAFKARVGRLGWGLKQL